ncbi:MAG: outer membrane lipoprotein carrier protein LolA [Chthoniobacter sp.]|nr:outer membrane lipoprotein carrier protein LolA [Chthoniobacter sp.]
MRLSAAIFLALLTTVRAADLPPAETQALMRNLQEHRAKFPALTADFVEERTTHLLTKPLSSEGTIAFQAPNKFRREVKGSSPSMTVTDGVKLWIYYPAFKEAELYTLGQKQFFDDSIAALTAGLNFQNVEKFYTYTAAREAAGYRLALTPRTGGLRRMVKELAVFVDADGKILRTEATLPKGDRVVTTYKNPRPTPLPASTFEFTPPPDAHVSQPLGK